MKIKSKENKEKRIPKKKQNKLKSIRARQFMFMQDVDHLKVPESELKNILGKSGAKEWAMIKHDKDKGVRPHYHITLKYDNPQQITSIAKRFKDKPQYVEVWKGRINNAYSYLLHRTSEAKKKYQYSPKDVIASFDFSTRINSIESNILLSPKMVKKIIDQYANEEITLDELQEKIGVMNFSKHKLLIDRINQVLARKKHNQFLKEFEGHRCLVFWLYGRGGAGKTKTAERFLKNRHSREYFVCGSQRDHFQTYEGQNYILLNDLRPRDYSYGDLLTMLDPYAHDKQASSRYYDKPLNAKMIIITTPYDLSSYYTSTYVDNRFVDRFEQLERRVIPIKVEHNNNNLVYHTMAKIEDHYIKKTKHTDQSNA